MLLTKEEFFNRINEYTKDRTDDDTISFIEDVTDTYNSMETDVNGNTAEAVAEAVAEVENKWREKYKARFFEAKGDGEKEEEKDEKGTEEIKIDDLFINKE